MLRREIHAQIQPSYVSLSFFSPPFSDMQLPRSCAARLGPGAR